MSRGDAKRRRLLKAIGAASVLPLHATAQPTPAAGDWKLEYQRGDPDLAEEALAFDRGAAHDSAARRGRAIFEPRNKAFNKSLIAEAALWIGKGRSNARGEITKLLEIFDLPFAYPDKTPLPFCAAGVSYVAALVYARRNIDNEAKLTRTTVAQYLGDVEQYHFGPTPSVWDMYFGARYKRRWSDANPAKLAPKPGWLVVFDFGAGADHVGIVEGYEAGFIRTIEFNTVPENAVGSEANGGMVARRRRRYIRPGIKGFVRTDL